MKITKYLLRSILIMALFSFPLMAKEKSSRWTIDAVNHQKVLLQQILKEYAFLGMGNDFKDSKTKLKLHLSDYASSLDELSVFLTDKKSKNYLKEAKAVWLLIEKDFKSKPSKEKVLNLQKKTDKILGKMSAVMKILLSKNAKGKHDIVSISGYQGVIVERMAALYMLKTWGISDPKFNFKMRESITFFNNSLHKMLESKETTAKNKKNIEYVMRSFKFFEIMNRSKTKFIPTLIYAKTKKIHVEIKKITQTYIKEGK